MSEFDNDEINPIQILCPLPSAQPFKSFLYFTEVLSFYELYPTFRPVMLDLLVRGVHSFHLEFNQSKPRNIKSDISLNELSNIGSIILKIIHLRTFQFKILTVEHKNG